MDQWTAQLGGLIVSTVITIALILVFYFFIIRKYKNGEAPSKMMVLLEEYYLGFNRMLNSITEGKNTWSFPYLFILFNFILINSLVPWIGFEAAPSTIMFTLPLALITFIGIYVVGIGTMGFWHFVKHKYKNPLEIFQQFSPLLSMSVRLFAATLAGAIIGNVVWVVVEGMVGPSSPIAIWFPAIQGTWKWVWMIIDSVLSLIQAYVFVVLTAIFWTMETGPSWSSKKRKKLREEKAAKEKGIKS